MVVFFHFWSTAFDFGGDFFSWLQHLILEVCELVVFLLTTTTSFWISHLSGFGDKMVNLSDEELPTGVVNWSGRMGDIIPSFVRNLDIPEDFGE